MNWKLKDNRDIITYFHTSLTKYISETIEIIDELTKGIHCVFEV